jgi:thiol-disulfide isomerase/thioredoxin
MVKIIASLLVLSFSVIGLADPAAPKVASANAASSPAKCNDTNAIYKTCGDQAAAFATAVAQAKKDGKVLFVTFGADWCPWCRSIHAVTTGDQFKKLLAAEKVNGKSLGDLVALHSVGVSHKIGDERQQVPSGNEIYQKIAADTKSGEQKISGIPTLVFLNPANNKAVFRGSENLESSDGKVGHDPAKIVAAIKEAFKKL